MRGRRLFFLLLYLPLVTLGLAELGVRLLGCSARYIHDGMYYRPERHPELPYLIRPHLEAARGRGCTVLTTDALGCRTGTPGLPPPGPAAPQEFRIAVFGDSVTYGEGVRDDADTFCRVLETELNRRAASPRVRVFNFGVSGYSVKTIADHALARAGEVAPDLVLMAVIGDDFNLARTPGVDRWGHNAAVDPAHPGRENSWIRHALRGFHLAWALRDVSAALRARGAAQPSGGAYDPAALWPDSLGIPKAFIQAAGERRWNARVVLLPDAADLTALRARLVADGVPLIDLSGVRAEVPPEAFTASPWDPHPSARVHGLLGRRLADALQPLVAGRAATAPASP